MTKHEELALYKKALIDWEKLIKIDYMSLGFCLYFSRVHKLWVYDDFKNILPILYNQRLIKTGMHHYRYDGDHKQGRQQRVTALKNAIEILENELKEK